MKCPYCSADIKFVKQHIKLIHPKEYTFLKAYSKGLRLGFKMVMDHER